MAYRALNASLFSTYHHGLGISQILNENIRLVKHKDALESATLSKRRNTKRKLQSENVYDFKFKIRLNVGQLHLIHVNSLPKIQEIKVDVKF